MVRRHVVRVHCRGKRTRKAARAAAPVNEEEPRRQENGEIDPTWSRPASPTGEGIGRRRQRGRGFVDDLGTINSGLDAVKRLPGYAVGAVKKAFDTLNPMNMMFGHGHRRRRRRYGGRLRSLDRRYDAADPGKCPVKVREYMRGNGMTGGALEKRSRQRVQNILFNTGAADPGTLAIAKLFDFNNMNVFDPLFTTYNPQFAAIAHYAGTNDRGLKIMSRKADLLQKQTEASELEQSAATNLLTNYL